ncbi:MAG: 4-(cytidine 5'-diphospho)-2-C-methyl-D-erythritol kinase [Gemmatimonadetes bacterium]|nr:4-(cytidine 5'-diphospho)-2-C-methyl-D-erythritol kinase [Gemmatimonadota bacterium]
MIRVLAPAKLHLHLEILAREESGYHQLETLFCELELADELELEPVARGVDVVLAATTPDASAALGPVPDNLVYRAARLYLEETGVGEGVRIRLTKRIPVGAGLGGGSSDAAATLLALDRLHRDRLGNAGRLRLGARLGSDVPFFLCGSPLALAWGRGGRLLTLEPLPPHPVLLLLPEERMSTAEAYAAVDRRRAGQEAGPEPSVLRPGRLGDWEHIARHARNDFEAVVFERHPHLAEAKRLLQREGALLALLTGSGSTVFGIFRDQGKLHRAVAAAETAGLHTIVTRTVCPPSPPPCG